MSYQRCCGLWVALCMLKLSVVGTFTMTLTYECLTSSLMLFEWSSTGICVVLHPQGVRIAFTLDRVCNTIISCCFHAHGLRF